LESLLVEIFQPLSDKEKLKSVSLSELSSASGLSESSIEDLEDREFIVPVKTKNGPVYEDIDIRIDQIFKRLAEFGLKPHDFDHYRQYIKLIRTEFETMHKTFHRHPNHEIIPLKELFKIANDLKGYLTLRVYRQEVQRLHQHGFDKRGDNETLQVNQETQ
jgi:hypothetical protein